MQRSDSISTKMPFKENSEVFKLQEMLSSGLFSIEPMVKKITKSQLRLLSTPGVAEVCLTIERDVESANEYSIRGKSIAIVSRGGLLNTSGNEFLPVMDWFVAQIKFYSNIDCYPFVIRPSAPLEQVIKDLSNSFRGVLFLDNEPIPMIQSNINFFILSHWNVCESIQCQKTDSEASSYILARLIKNNINGIVSKEKIFEFLEEGALRVSRSEMENFELDIDGMEDVTPLKLHKAIQGKIHISLNFEDIQPLKKIFTLENILKVIRTHTKCTCRTLNAIVTDGTAVLGLGNIGPIAGLPVMEAKSMIFRAFGGVQVVPVCINPRYNTNDTISAILDLVYLFKAINLEDFRSPECFSIERTMKIMHVLPVFHDDQHGTAIATLAAFINATKLAKLVPSECKVVINGAGAAGISIAKILYEFGVRNLIVCDRAGIIYKGRRSNMNEFKEEVSEFTNFEMIKGTLPTAIIGANIFIGVSTKNTLKKEWIKKMCPKPIIFAMANPDPEISRSDAMEEGCFMYGCGRAGEPNQITNSLVYPGIFKAINEKGVEEITPEMEVLAALEIAKSVKGELSTDNYMPSCLNLDIAIRIAEKLGNSK